MAIAFIASLQPAARISKSTRKDGSYFLPHAQSSTNPNSEWADDQANDLRRAESLAAHGRLRLPDSRLTMPPERLGTSNPMPMNRLAIQYVRP